MTATTTTLHPLWGSKTASEFIVDALQALFFPPQGETDGSREEERYQRLRSEPIFAAIKALTCRAMEAQNGPDLRQALAEIALSPELVSFEASQGVLSEAKPEDFLQLPLLHPRASERLGAQATSLLMEAFRLSQPVLVQQSASGELERQLQMVRQVEPHELASQRGKLVLGDLLPPPVAETVLSSFRGQVAFLALVQASIEPQRLPDWKAIALGEIAVEGMKAMRRLTLPSSDHLDLEEAIRAHQEWKEELFARLESGESMGLDEESDEP